jgi:putative ABC transport system permease protein
MAIKSGLFVETVTMALDTVRTQKMRSALTVLGVVIGITSIVGMTSIIRGFDESLRESILQLGAETIFVTQFSGVSLAANEDFSELMRRPSLTVDDGAAIRAQSPSIAEVALILGQGGRSTQSRLFFEGRRTKNLSIFGTTDNYTDVMHLDVEMGRFFTASEVSHRRRVVVLGPTPYQALFPKIDPIGRTVRIGNVPYSVIGVLGSRPSPGGLNVGQDDFAVIPHSAYQKQFGISVTRSWRGRLQSVMIAAVPRENASREEASLEVENVMRIRHGLRLDEANDFDLLTQDSVLRLWERISSATFLALVSISSIALMVGGIGVMAIMTISVKERTREIGTRRALGARRREILQQFLLEAVFLTGIGGILGVVLGSGVGVAVHLITDFPISLPWWSFALGVGFSGTVGVAFGLFPAIRASGLDPIEALRYE